VQAVSNYYENARRQDKRRTYPHGRLETFPLGCLVDAEVWQSDRFIWNASCEANE